MRMLRRTLVWLLAVALVLGAAGPSAAAAARCMASGKQAMVAAALAGDDCATCDDRGGSSGAQSNCPLATCTTACTIGPAASAGEAFALAVFDTAGLMALAPGDPAAARRVPPDPPPPR